MSIYRAGPSSGPRGPPYTRTTGLRELDEGPARHPLHLSTINRKTRLAMVKIPHFMRPEPVDPVYNALSSRWHTARAATCSPYDHLPFILADTELRNYVYNKAERMIAEDRRLHPKARRNAPTLVRDASDPLDVPSRQLH